MPDPAYRLGISEFTTWPWTFEQDVEAYARHGVAAIEVTEAKMDPNRIEEQLAEIGKRRLEIASVQAQIHALYPTLLQPEPRDPRDRVAHIRASIERFATRVPARTPFVLITGRPPSGDIAEVLRTARREFGELARVAAAHGLRVALEPLNPSLLNVDSSIWALDDALALVQEVDHEAFGLCVDTWNVWKSPKLDETIAAAGDRIFLVQVSDWGSPRGYYDRLVPGDGCIPLGPLLQSVRRAGYTRPYVIEIFSSESLPGSLWKGDLDGLLDRSIEGFDRLWRRFVAA